MSAHPPKTVEPSAPLLPGRVLSLDLGERRVGVAVCDELHLTIRPLQPLARSNWKAFLAQIRALVETETIVALVVGLPLRLDGTEGEAAAAAREVARKLILSLALPVYLQDERLTTRAAAENLQQSGVRDYRERQERIDGEAAALILRDFLAAATAQANFTK